jgi:hypothetical protein
MQRMPPVRGSIATMLPTLLHQFFTELLQFHIKTQVHVFSGNRQRIINAIFVSALYTAFVIADKFLTPRCPINTFSYERSSTGTARVIAYLVAFVFVPLQVSGIHFAYIPQHVCGNAERISSDGAKV